MRSNNLSRKNELRRIKPNAIALSLSHENSVLAIDPLISLTGINPPIIGKPYSTVLIWVT